MTHTNLFWPIITDDNSVMLIKNRNYRYNILSISIIIIILLCTYIYINWSRPIYVIDSIESINNTFLYTNFYILYKGLYKYMIIYVNEVPNLIHVYFLNHIKLIINLVFLITKKTIFSFDYILIKSLYNIGHHIKITIKIIKYAHFPSHRWWMNGIYILDWRRYSSFGFLYTIWLGDYYYGVMLRPHWLLLFPKKDWWVLWFVDCMRPYFYTLSIYIFKKFSSYPMYLHIMPRSFYPKPYIRLCRNEFADLIQFYWNYKEFYLLHYQYHNLLDRHSWSIAAYRFLIKLPAHLFVWDSLLFPGLGNFFLKISPLKIHEYFSIYFPPFFGQYLGILHPSLTRPFSLLNYFNQLLLPDKVLATYIVRDWIPSFLHIETFAHVLKMIEGHFSVIQSLYIDVINEIKTFEFIEYSTVVKYYNMLSQFHHSRVYGFWSKRDYTLGIVVLIVFYLMLRGIYRYLIEIFYKDVWIFNLFWTNPVIMWREMYVYDDLELDYIALTELHNKDVFDGWYRLVAGLSVVFHLGLILSILVWMFNWIIYIYGLQMYFHLDSKNIILYILFLFFSLIFVFFVYCLFNFFLLLTNWNLFLYQFVKRIFVSVNKLLLFFGYSIPNKFFGFVFDNVYISNTELSIRSTSIDLSLMPYTVQLMYNKLWWLTNNVNSFDSSIVSKLNKFTVSRSDIIKIKSNLLYNSTTYRQSYLRLLAKRQLTRNYYFYYYDWYPYVKHNSRWKPFDSNLRNDGDSKWKKTRYVTSVYKRIFNVR